MNDLVHRGHPWRWVLAGGLVAGTFDITYASTFWGIKAGVSPLRVCQSVAAGLLGRASFQGGTKTAVLGLALHYFIAISMAITFYLVARFLWRSLANRPLFYGALYGLLLYGIMNYVVIPLSRASRGSKDAVWVGLSIAVHMFLIGLPIALFASKDLRQSAGTRTILSNEDRVRNARAS